MIIFSSYFRAQFVHKIFYRFQQQIDFIQFKYVLDLAQIKNYIKSQFKSISMRQETVWKSKINFNLGLTFLFLIVLASSQTTVEVKTQEIALNSLYNITLEKGQTKVYTVTIKNLKTDQSLFVETISPTYDPYQIPKVTIKSDNKFQKSCTQQTNEYLGICEVEYQKLKEGQIFNISIMCSEKCDLKLLSFLTETLEMNFGDKVQIHSQQSVDTLQGFRIKVPETLNFTDISLIANFLNEATMKEGTEMFVNVGNSSVKVPTPQEYNFKGRQVWGDGVGVFLSGKDIKAGQWISVLLVIGKGVQLQFYSQAGNGNKFDILLNTAYRDFTSEDQTKLYILDLSSLANANVTNALQNKTVEIIFVVYSGMPDVKVSFDPTFKTYLDNFDIQGTFSYLLTPDIRKKYNFTGSVYIQVQSFWTSNYYLYPFTVSDKFYMISDGISQLNRAQPNQVQNYIYESYVVVDQGKEQVESYRVKIEIMEGMADVGIRRCLSLQQNDTFQCLITNASQLQDETVKKSFDQLNITLRKDWDAYELLFDYNTSLCSKYKTFTDIDIYNCEFQIIVFPAKNTNTTLIYSVTMFQDREQSELKEGYAYKDYIYADTYHYYQFNLPSIENVQQVTFFMTIINGDAGLMGTTNPKFQYMEFSDAIAQQDITYSFFNSLTFTKDQLKKTFFIAVFAYQTTDLTVSVIVKRADQAKNNTNGTSTNQTTQSTTLSLVEGLSQQYTLDKGHSKIDFAFTAQKAQNITVELIQIQGIINFFIQKSGTTNNITCINKIQPGELKCTFTTEQKAKYLVHVSSVQSDIQTFSISYFSSSDCKKYSFNLPQFVFLPAKQKQCSNFSIIDQSKSLQIITSFSTIDLLSTDVVFTATFNDLHPVEFTGRSKLFTSDELKQFCKSDSMSNCNMKIEVKGDEQINSKFYFVVEQVGKEMVLFDGIVRKVVDEKMSQTKGKFFYYEVTSMKDSVKIFTTNRDNVGYYVGAKFVNISEFIASPDNLYLPFRENLTTPLKNAFETRLLPQKGTSMIQIDSQQFAEHCSTCVILISVYGLQKDSSEANIFQIEVTQTESFIYLGEQQIGFLSEDEIYMYDVYANPDGESLLTIRDFLKESGKEKDCFSASILEIGTTNTAKISSGYQIIPKSVASYKVFIENTGDQICAYQISFSSLAKPVTEITPFMPIQIKISNRQSRYFLYHHRQSTSFQILNYIKTGDMKIYANKVTEIITVENLVNKNLDMYDFVSQKGDSFLEIKNTSSKFVKNSYYMIAVKGDPIVVAEMAIVRGEEPIGLTTYGVLKQTLDKGEIENYVYYSIFDFNVTIPILFGEIRVIIITPEKKTFYNQTVKISTEIFVPKPNTAQGQYMDYFNENSRFEIQIEAVKDSSYYISVKRQNVSLRVYEGIPVTLALENETKTIQFVNANSSDNVSLLLEVKEDVPESFAFSVSAQVMKEGQTSSSKIDNPIVKKSQKSWNYLFPSIKGTYFITLGANSKVTTSFILVKKKMTHLMSSHSNLFTAKGTFQIYTPGNNLMIVVDSCLSQVQVRASQKYQAIADNNSGTSPVLLQHANYGGHYIITAENVEGEYFVEVNPKNTKDNMLYIISYYYYNKQDDMPYKKVDVDPEITYELAADKIIFTLNPVRLLPSKQKLNIIPTYTLFISNSANTTSMNTRCDLNVGFSLTQPAPQNSDQPIKFAIDLKTLANQIGEKTEVYYVSAKVKVKLEGTDLVSDYIPYIDLAYSKLQLTQSTHTVEFKSETTSNVKYILLWVVVPVIISLLLFVLALKFCIKKYKMLYPDQLVEQDVEMGESEGEMNSKSNKAADSLNNT